MINHPSVQRSLAQRKCFWTFITSRAPWQDGFTQRLIGIVKNCLRKTLHRTKLGLEELKTAVVEIENRINNCPLIYLNDSLVNIESVTPSHLLHGRRLDPISSLDIREEMQHRTVDDTAQHTT